MEKTRHAGIYRRAGSKRTTYYVVEYVPGDDGSQRQKWHSGYRTLAEARAAQTEIRNRKSTGTYVAPSKTTLTEFVENDWLPAVKRSVRPSTYTSYESNLRCHVLGEIGHHRLQHITPGMLNRLYTSLEESERGLSARTIRYVHTILRRVLSDAVRQERLVRNPTDGAQAPSASAAKPPRMQTWSADELRKFLAQVREDRLYAAWRFAALTGARRGEVLGLRWQDVDLEADPPRVSISETLIGDREASTPKTESGRRSIDLDSVTATALRTHRKRQAEERLALGPAYDSNDFVFCREDGTPIWPRTFSRAFASHVKAAGLPSIPLKNLRHTHATILLANGVSPKVIQERLGHADIVITLRVYAAAIPAMHSEATQKAAALIDG